MFFTVKDQETNLLETRTVLHQVHAASVMISSHMDISLEALQHPSREYISCMLCITFLVSASPACSVTALAVMIKSFTLAVMIESFTLTVMGFACMTSGPTPDGCFGDVLHLV